MTRLIAVRIGHPRGAQTNEPTVNDSLGLSDSLTFARSAVISDPLGLTDTRNVVGGGGLGLAPLGTSTLGG